MRPCPTGAAMSPPDLTVDPFHRPIAALDRIRRGTRSDAGTCRDFQTDDGGAFHVAATAGGGRRGYFSHRPGTASLAPKGGERESVRSLATHPETTILEAPRNGPRRLVRLLVGAWRRVMQARGLGRGGCSVMSLEVCCTTGSSLSLGLCIYLVKMEGGIATFAEVEVMISTERWFECRGLWAEQKMKRRRTWWGGVGALSSSMVEDRGRGSNAGVVSRAGSPFCPTTRLERGSPSRTPRSGSPGPVRQSSHPLVALITTLFSELQRRRLDGLVLYLARQPVTSPYPA